MYGQRCLMSVNRRTHTYDTHMMERDNHEWKGSEKSEICGTMSKEIVKFFGHVMGKGELEDLVTSGFVEGKNLRGRQLLTYLTYLSKRKQSTAISLIHQTNKRYVWIVLSKWPHTSG